MWSKEEIKRLAGKMPDYKNVPDLSWEKFKAGDPVCYWYKHEATLSSYRNLVAVGQPTVLAGQTRYFGMITHVKQLGNNTPAELSGQVSVFVMLSIDGDTPTIRLANIHLMESLKVLVSGNMLRRYDGYIYPFEED